MAAAPQWSQHQQKDWSQIGTVCPARSKGLVVQKGFTNMAQAIMKMKALLTHTRKVSRSVGMFITDGRPSHKSVTNHAVASRLMIVHVQANRQQQGAELLKDYVREP